MAEKSRGRRFIAYGCLGCLGLLGLAVAAVAVVAGIAWSSVQREQPERRRLTPEIPGAVEALPPAGASALPEAGGEAATGPGRIVLDLRHGAHSVKPAQAGEPLRVDATYDATGYELLEHFEEDDGQGWLYSASFRRTGSGLMAAVKQLLGGTQPELTVHLPRDRPYALELRMEEGGGQIELGGLTLTDLDLTLAKGGVKLDVSEPLAAPLDELTVSAQMGGFELSGVGNASPRRLDVTLSMGGGEIDLRGAWRQDAQISIRTSMSGGTLTLPDGVTIRGVEGRLGLEPDPENPRPVLEFLSLPDPESWEID